MTARRVLIALSFVVAAAVGAAGVLVVGAVEAFHRAEEAMAE